MTDIIQLLPDAIANQIAAGEVVQRPASVVKELMENAIDAGGTAIKLIIKDSGKTLIQVIDDGCGMSETDARMSFERHATSKIRRSEDLFAIRTMGFRGEALASIAAVAQVEMRTRRRTDDVGVRLAVEASEVKAQEACQCSPGTSISVKNLFYNIPARRNFLKSPTVELRHIIDEFQRVALANPDLFFSLHHNGAEIHHLPAGNLRQRIVGIFGNQYNQRLIPLDEETDLLRLSGFVSKPEFAKKSRGEQLFFVNQRFIKSTYLNHAVMTAYEGLLPKDAYPMYVIFLDIDPAQIDINVHPTKQEIKFEDERLVYNYLRVAARHALGQYSLMPMLDFEQDTNFGIDPAAATPHKPAAAAGPDAPKRSYSSDMRMPSPTERELNNLKNWESIYAGLSDREPGEAERTEPTTTFKSDWAPADTLLDDEQGSFSKERKAPYQLHGTYIISPIKSGFLLIDQQAAHERILYERYLSNLDRQSSSSQQQLFPRTISLPPADAAILREIRPQINLLGFDVQEFGTNTFVINGVPAEISGREDEVKVLEGLVAQYRENIDLKIAAKDSLARAMARHTCMRRGHALTVAEMQALIDSLFGCQVPLKSPSGRACFITYDLGELAKRFEA